MATTTIKKAQHNTTQFGAGQFSRIESVTSDLPESFTDSRKTIHLGWGHFGERGWGKVYDYSIRTPTPTAGEAAPIVSFANSAGAIVGTIRTDVQETIVQSIKFTIIKGDCRDFKLTLNKPPKFPLLPFSFVQISLANGTSGWYYGKIKEAPEPGDENADQYVYTGFGLSEELAGINGDGLNYSAGTDVGAIIYDLAYNRIAVETKIGIIDSNINTVTGIPIIADITLDKTSLNKALDSFAAMTSHDWGVNGDNEFFFLPRVSSEIKTWYIGYNLQEFKLSQNLQGIKNRILGKRTSLPGSGTPGWVIGAISNDEKSQRKYGTREETIKVPGNFSDADITLLTDAILAQKKEPQYTAKSKSYYVRDQNDFVERGQSRFILPFAEYNFIYNTCDDPVTDFSLTASGDLVISQDETNYIDGQSSLKMQWTSAAGDRIEYVAILKGLLQRIRFYYRAEVEGQIIRIGIGNGVWDEYTWDLTVSTGMTGIWIPYDLDISSYNIRKIDRIGFEVLTTDPGIFNIDRIEFRQKSNRHITLENQKQTYLFSGDEISIEQEHGPIVPRLENYLTALFAQVEEARVTGEIK